jgi:hypothetical protein
LPNQELDSYLFYIVNAFGKNNASPKNKKQIEYLCPGCLYLGKDNYVYLDRIFKCDECARALKLTSDPKETLLFKTFANHNKVGYHCPDCDKFIPQPLDNSKIISCPYYDCIYVGEFSDLKKMHHPASQINPEKLSLDTPADGDRLFKDNMPDNSLNACSQLQLQEELNIKVQTIRDVIENQSNGVPYSSSDFTIKHKLLTYKAFRNILDKYPSDMANYLLNNSRSGGFQHKIFQEYINLLEQSFPFCYKKKGKIYRIDSLLDDNLKLFDGISVFSAIISDKLEIKNNTEEFYIGGRKATYTKSYYIGKLLNIINKTDKTSLMNNVQEYSFCKIKMNGLKPGTEVVVSHLRVPPHYQMGGMAHINRIRKKIIDRANLLLSNNNV